MDAVAAFYISHMYIFIYGGIDNVNAAGKFVKAPY